MMMLSFLELTTVLLNGKVCVKEVFIIMFKLYTCHLIQILSPLYLSF